MIHRRAILSLCIVTCISATSLAAAPLVEGQFIRVKNGHLSYNNKRIRLWGTNFVHAIKRAGPDLTLTFDRIQEAGFNAVRVNMMGNMVNSQRDPQNPNLPADSLWVPQTVRGDGSLIDRLDQAIYEAKQRGMFFWLTFDRFHPFNEADYDLLPDDGTREEWKEIIKHGSTIVYFDRRAEQTFQLYAKNVLEHVNPYTRKKYADEEAIGLWEIFNECSFVENLISQKHEGLVEQRITQRWNEWLLERYKTDAALKKAWGELMPGESLEKNNIAFAPIRTNAKQITKAGVQHEYVIEKNGAAAQYPAARGEDVMRFAYDLYEGHTERFIAYVRTLGKGIAQIPITPTGRYANSLHNYYAASSCGDFTSMGVYSFNVRPWMMKNKLKDSPFYPYTIRSNEHPLMEQPIDLVRVPNRPHLIYECNDFRPNPYAMEFWTRMALFASWQDYDAVFWFHWDCEGYLPALAKDDDYVQSKLPMPDANYPNAGIVQANDEAALAGLKAAGAMFLANSVKPAAKPVTITIGKDMLLDPFHQGVDTPMNGTTFMEILRPYVWQKGMRTVFSLQKPSKLPPPLQFTHGHIQVGPDVVWDWNHGMGFVQIDTPTTKLYTGFLRPYLRFKGDVTLTHINRMYGTFAIVAQDGKPLEQSKDILIVAMSRSTNTHTNVYPERLTTEDYYQQGLAQQVQPGGEPKHIDRIGGELYAPWLKGKICERYTFARAQYRPAEELTTDRLTLYEYEPIFYYRIHTK